MLEYYKKCINDIDDYFEYRYKDKMCDDIKNDIMKCLDELNEKIISDERENNKPQSFDYECNYCGQKWNNSDMLGNTTCSNCGSTNIK